MSIRARDWVRQHAEHRPGAVALVRGEDGHGITWHELDHRVGRLAGALAGLGVGKGDRVALIAENDPRVFEVQFAAMRLGALFVPLNWRLSTHELVEICLDAEPVVLLHDQEWAEVAREIAAGAGIARRIAWDATEHNVLGYEAALSAADYREPWEDILLNNPSHVLYTSGTTGRPKGALSTHGTLLWQAVNLAFTTGVAEPGCHQLNPMPLFHAGGLNVMANPILHFGGTVTTLTRFRPDVVLGHLAGTARPVTHFAAIPLMYRQIAEEPGFPAADLSHARHFVVAGAIAGPELLRTWAERGLPLQPQYGGTEMGPTATALDDQGSSFEKAALGSTGRRAFHTDIRLADERGREVPDGTVGEIWLRGPSITVGYWHQDRADHFSGEWFRTGDTASRDADGFYYPAGRLKEMYKSGGENVYPAEVENVLSEHPAVADVAVIGVPDPQWTEVGLAVIVPSAGTRPTLEELRAFAAARLARYKLPKQLVLVDALPRNVTGKVSRESLRRRYAG